MRIESLVEPDDRATPWESTRVLAVPGNEVLAILTMHTVTGAITFPAPGCVEMHLHGRYGSKHKLRINARAQSFALDDGPEQHLSKLEALVYPPERDAVPQPVAVAANGLVQVGSALASLAFVAGGLWMALGAGSAKDRWIGVACVLFFGLCAGTFIAEWRRGRRCARRPASQCVRRSAQIHTPPTAT